MEHPVRRKIKDIDDKLLEIMKSAGRSLKKDFGELINIIEREAPNMFQRIVFDDIEKRPERVEVGKKGIVIGTISTGSTAIIILPETEHKIYMCTRVMYAGGPDHFEANSERPLNDIDYFRFAEYILNQINSKLPSDNKII